MPSRLPHTQTLAPSTPGPHIPPLKPHPLPLTHLAYPAPNHLTHRPPLAPLTPNHPPPPHLVCPVIRLPSVLQQLQPFQHTGQEPGGLKGAIGISRPKRLIPCGPAVGNVNAVPCILFIARQEESQSLEGLQQKPVQCAARSKMGTTYAESSMCAGALKTILQSCISRNRNNSQIRFHGAA